MREAIIMSQAGLHEMDADIFTELYLTKASSTQPVL